MQLEEVAVFSQAKTHALQSADVAFFPVGSGQHGFGHVREGPFHAGAADVERFWVEVVNFFIAGVEQQVAFPQAQDQKTFALRLVKVPGFWRVVIEFDDGERELGPSEFSGGVGLREEGSGDGQEENG